MGVRRWVAAVSLTALVTVGGLVGTATGASALPEDCTVELDRAASRATSLCTAGTGEHQVAMKGWIDFPPRVVFCFGRWSPVGERSLAACALRPMSAWVNRR